MLIFGVFSIGSAQDIVVDTEPTAMVAVFELPLKTKFNDVMYAAYQDILSVKDDYEELQNFDRTALSKNRYGVYSINYYYEGPLGPYEKAEITFGLTIFPEDDETYDQYGRKAFYYGFPLLGAKFSGYQVTVRYRDAFDIHKMIQKHGDVLLEEQKKNLPLVLSIEALKDSYHIDESVDFIVSLENVSAKNYRIKDLNAGTLKFFYDEKELIAKDTGQSRYSGQEKIVLDPSEKISKKFTISGFSDLGDVVIYCSYLLTFKGVEPSGILRIKIIE